MTEGPLVSNSSARVRLFIGREPHRRARLAMRRFRRQAEHAGPRAVAGSLIEGLARVGVEMPVETEVGELSGVVGALSGSPDQLCAVAEARRRGQVGRLVMGPNFFTLPSDVRERDLACIDAVIVPCRWVADLYAADAPAIADRIAVWPAGVDTQRWQPGSGRRGSVAIYDKVFDQQLVTRCIAAVSRARLTPEVVRYGAYTQGHYRDVLGRSRFMVWLSRSESQGIALFEAWSADVPTLCVDFPSWRAGAPSFLSSSTSAPYLTDDRGMLCGDGAGEVEGAIAELASRAPSLRPRATIVGHHDLETAALEYSAILRGDEVRA